MKTRKSPTPRIAALAQVIDTATSVIQLLPAGTFAGVDGRPKDTTTGKWYLDAGLAAKLVDAVTAAKTRPVIDYEHQTLRAVTNGQPAPASGWIDRIEWRDDGLFAVVEWTQKAAAMIADGEYRYISPVFTYDSSGNVTGLLHASLTNTPALDGMDEVMLAAASRLTDLSTTPEETMDKEQLENLLAQLRYLLNLAATATPDDVTAELQKIITAVAAKRNADTDSEEIIAAASFGGLLDWITTQKTRVASLSATQYNPAKYVPIEVVTDLQTRLAALSRDSNAVQLDNLIQAALSDGRLFKSQVDWAREYGQQDIAALSAWLDKAPRIAALNRQQTGSGFNPPSVEDRADALQLTPEQIAICNQFGNDPANIGNQLKD